MIIHNKKFLKHIYFPKTAKRQTKVPNLLEMSKTGCFRQKRLFPIRNEQVERPDLLKATRFLKNEQVKGPNLLGNRKTGAFRTGNEQTLTFRTENGSILYRTSEIKHFV